MSGVRMLCQICGVKIATRTCPMCGRAVCDSDFDQNLGICGSCKHGRRIEG